MWNGIAAAAAAAAGALIAWLNGLLTDRLMRRTAASSMTVPLVRQLINVGFLVLVYFVSARLPVSPVWTLVGAAAGLSLVSTLLLVRLSRREAAREAAEAAARASKAEKTADEPEKPDGR